MAHFRLDGKVAIVTGAGRGIGRALAIGLAEAGAEVVVMSRTVADLEETARLIERAGGKSYIVSADVSNINSIRSSFKKVDGLVPSVDILVNNAGMNIRSKADDVTEAEWQQILDTNSRSAFFCAQEAKKRMADGGSIISIASVAGTRALRTGVAYGASKAALIQMTKTLALEWGAENIRVNAIGPWYFETPLTKKLLEDEAYVQNILSVTPLKRIGQLEELVGPVIFLASNASSYMTGQTLFVDGGMTIHGF
ncbi:SDR family NAD(P)-dependent oxidoreductase [Bacillus fonticola]|uniref:SDR family NAD(P)-dependent oxidoreductase n=1 Tax=Bacillus fonticola TaxID=2728853 RepID=UPI0014733B2C|nr:glucose 1-dehydrogenase [Bacillus fonticola]